ncbi:MAG: polysaccharide deacetylase family protein [Thermodesulfobacteriota bacterium]
MRGERAEWPNGARIVIATHVVLEQWSGLKVESGRTGAPGLPEEAIRSGKKDFISLSWAEYAGKVGIWRLLDVVEKHHVSVSAVFSGLAVERFTDAARAFVERGSEIIAHSYAQDIRSWMLDPDAERENIRRCISIIQDATGQRPLGWISPGAQSSESTARLLAEEGFLYHCDYAGDDLPRIETMGGKRIVANPFQFEINDMRTLRGGISPLAFLDIFKRTFDWMYQEGTERPGVLTMAVHASISGRPSGVWAFDEAIHYAKRFPDVWFARRADIASWWLQRYG